MAGLSLSALVAGLLAVLVLVGDDRYDAAPPAPATGRPSAAGAASTLKDLVDAVAAGDVAAASALAPDGDREAAERLEGVVANAVAAGVEGFALRYVDETGPAAPDGSWTAAVDATWRFAGFDRTPARTEVLVRFAAAGEQVVIERLGGVDEADGRRTPLWLRDGLSVVRDGDVLVLSDGARQGAVDTAARVRRGVEVVRRVLPGWREPVVVEVPASGAHLDETLGAEPGTYAGIAAVTTTPDGSARAGASAHVFVNPEVTRGLRSAGAQVVMSHELTHLATDAAGSGVDLWLLEGFADYVALRDVPLPETTTAARAVASVRRDGLPRALPGPEAFDTRAADLQAAYELAWLACDVVADEVGEAALVELYRDASSGTPLARALARAGLTERELLLLWRGRLRDLAS